MRLTENARSPAYTTACASSFTGLARNVSTQSMNYTYDTGTGTHNTYNYGTGTSMLRNEQVTVKVIIGVIAVIIYTVKYEQWR
jgi:hypothetical protein